MTSLFRYLSKTDEDVLPYCTQKAIYKQETIGLMILLTGIFAFGSGSYAVSLMFQIQTPEGIGVSTRGYLISPVVGLIYGLMIITFNGALASVPASGLQILPRTWTEWKCPAFLLQIFVAVLIGIIVSYPVELFFFEDNIEKQLRSDSKENNENDYLRKTKATDKVKQKGEGLESNVQKYKDSFASWEEVMENEVVGRVKEGRTGIAGEGPAYRAAKKNADTAEDYLEEAKTALLQFNETRPQEIERINEEYQTQEIQQAYDILARATALGVITNNSSSAWWIAFFIMMFFIIIELLPVAVKALFSLQEYDALLESRAEVNNQFIYARANKFLKDMEENPDNAPFPFDEIKKNIQK